MVWWFSENAQSKAALVKAEAKGLWLTPGLLDIHTHFDLEVELAPGLPEAVRHGTTTVVASNCSLGLAFGAQRRADSAAGPIVDCFARVENILKPVLKKVADRDAFGHEQLVNRSSGVVAYVFVAGNLAWERDEFTPLHGTQMWGRALTAKSWSADKPALEVPFNRDCRVVSSSALKRPEHCCAPGLCYL